MEKLLMFLSMVGGEAKRRKPKDTPWFWFLSNGFSNFLIVSIVWVWWVCSWPWRGWSWERSTVGKLEIDKKDHPYSVDKIIKHIKESYPDDTELTIARYPSFSIGHDVWKFKVYGGVSNDKAHTFRVSC